MKKVSFDFDDTLSLKQIQEYAKTLAEQEIEIHIVTTRYEDLSKYSTKLLEQYGNFNHDDLFKITKELNIPRERVHFTDFTYKCEFFKDKDFIWHLDDNQIELDLINYGTNVKGINALTGNYEQLCNELLK